MSLWPRTSTRRFLLPWLLLGLIQLGVPGCRGKQFNLGVLLAYTGETPIGRVAAGSVDMAIDKVGSCDLIHIASDVEVYLTLKILF